QRNHETDDKADAERRAALLGEPRQLLAQYVDGSARGNSRNRVEMVHNRARVGKQSINRNQSRYAREQRQKRIERHPRGIGEDAVLRNAFVDAPQDILPSRCRDLRWAIGKPTAPGIELV